MALLKIILGVFCLIIPCYSLLITMRRFVTYSYSTHIKNHNNEFSLLFCCFLIVILLIIHCYSIVIFRTFLDIKLVIVPHLISGEMYSLRNSLLPYGSVLKYLPKSSSSFHFNTPPLRYEKHFSNIILFYVIRWNPLCAGY